MREKVSPQKVRDEVSTQLLCGENVPGTTVCLDRERERERERDRYRQRQRQKSETNRQTDREPSRPRNSIPLCCYIEHTANKNSILATKHTHDKNAVTNTKNAQKLHFNTTHCYRWLLACHDIVQQQCGQALDKQLNSTSEFPSNYYFQFLFNQPIFRFPISVPKKVSDGISAVQMVYGSVA